MSGRKSPLPAKAKKNTDKRKKSQRDRAPLTSEALPVIGVPPLPVGVCGRQMSVLAPSSADGISPKNRKTAHSLAVLERHEDLTYLKMNPRT